MKRTNWVTYLFGEKKTPEAFRNACHKFVFTEVLRPDIPTDLEPPPTPAGSDQPSISTAATTKTTEPKPKFPKKFVVTALEQSVDDTGWANLGTFGSYLTKLQPDFDSRLLQFRLRRTKARSCAAG